MQRKSKTISDMNHTSIEQSGILIELGLKPETADMCFWKGTPFLTSYSDATWSIKKELTPDEQKFIEQYQPCWSTDGLLKAMCRVKGYYPCLCRNNETHKFQCCCSKYDTPEYDNPIDACFDMMCWLFKEHWMKYAETMNRTTED